MQKNWQITISRPYTLASVHSMGIMSRTVKGHTWVMKGLDNPQFWPVKDLPHGVVQIATITGPKPRPEELIADLAELGFVPAGRQAIVAFRDEYGVWEGYPHLVSLDGSLTGAGEEPFYPASIAEYKMFSAWPYHMLGMIVGPDYQAQETDFHVIVIPKE